MESKAHDAASSKGKRNKNNSSGRKPGTGADDSTSTVPISADTSAASPGLGINPNDVVKDDGRLSALELQAQRTESNMELLSSSLNDLKDSHNNLFAEFKASQAEIVEDIRARDVQLNDRLTQQEANLDNKFSDQLAAIANLISSSANNNNNNNSNNVRQADTPYSSEVEFVPTTPKVADNSYTKGLELFSVPTSACSQRTNVP